MRSTSFSLLLIVTVLTMLFALPAAAEDPRVRQVEIDLARLQREVDSQQRRIDQLEREMRTSGQGRTASGAPRAAESSPAWLVVANWDRVRNGMKALEVIAILGRPTSVREGAEGGQQTFFYAMELGPASVLSGNVRFGKQGVAEVQKPELR